MRRFVPSPKGMSRRKPKSSNWTLGEPLQNSMHKRKNMMNFLSSERHKCSHLNDRVVKKVSKTNFGGITNKAICWGISAMLGISPMVGIWGAPHAPNVRRCRYSGSPNPFKDASYLGSQPQAPNISDGMYLGVAQAPRCLWGAPHAPKFRRCRYSGSPNPSRGRKLFGEPTPSPQYLRWRVFGSCPSPGCIWGAPHAPDIIFHSSLFIFHFLLS